MARVPHDVQWSADGFSVGLVSRPGERLAVQLSVLLIVVLATLSCAALLSSDFGHQAGDLDALLPYAVRMLLALLGLLGMALLYLGWSKPRTTQVGLTGFVVHVGPWRVPVADVLRCDSHEAGLVLHTTQGRRRIFSAVRDPSELVWIRDQIRAARAKWSARTGSVPEALEALRQD